jgi:hypothetical protein
MGRSTARNLSKRRQKQRNARDIKLEKKRSKKAPVVSGKK